MALTSIYGSSSRMRISGMSSGWDTDQLVTSMSMNQRNRVNKAYQNMRSLEMKRDAYKSINTLTSGFSTSFLSVASPNTIKSVNTFKAAVVKMADNGCVKISANADATFTNHRISIERVAGSSTFDSTRTVSDSLHPNTLLTDLGITFDELPPELDDEGNPKEGPTKYAPKTLTLSNMVNGELKTAGIQITKNDTVASLFKKINDAKIGVKASISEISGKIQLATTATGSGAMLELSETFDDGNTSLFSLLGFDFENRDYFHQGEDALFYIDGYEHTSSTNVVQMDGLTIELLSKTSDDINFTVERDATKTLDAIKKFVDDFNAMYSSLYTMLTEKSNLDYPPLTPEQKEGLTESEIAQWEEKAKSGAVHNDQKISSLLSELRNAFNMKVPGTNLTFADIGITTAPYKKGEIAKIVINEDKLMKAITDSPDDVVTLFTAGGTEENRMETAGLATRISTAFSNYNEKIRAVGFTDTEFQYEIDKLDKKVKAETAKLEKEQERLYEKLAAMETALSKMQSQSTWLANQLGGSSQ